MSTAVRRSRSNSPARKKQRTDTMPSANSSSKKITDWESSIVADNCNVVSKIEQLDEKYRDRNFICTHHGGFHCDEALAIAMLKLLPEFQNLPILRTRDPETIKQAKIVVDVGGEYSMDSLRFDHHMGTFNTFYAEKYHVTKLSSAGLVYKHFGERLVSVLVEELGMEEDYGKPGSKEFESAVKTLTKRLYDGFIEEVDAIDNGVEQGENLKYRVSSGLGNRVKRCNANWREEASNTPEAENARFLKAVSICAEEFLGQATGLITSWYPARKIVTQTLEDKSNPNRVMVLKQCCPWQEHLLDLEKERGMSDDNNTLYVTFPDTRSGTYRIQAVPKAKGSFVNRKPLPEPWRGVRDDELSKVAKIEGCVFAHASGFIGGNKTLEGVIKMAEISRDW